MRIVKFGIVAAIGCVLPLFCQPAYALRAISETVIYSFCSRPNCIDGSEPSGTLVRDAKGNLFGTTIHGGSSRCGFGPHNCGVVYRIEPGGKEIVLYAFAGRSSLGVGDGAAPFGSLAIGQTGRLFGATTEGGGGAFNQTGNGAVFEIDFHHREQILHAFCADRNCSDGALPWSGITLDKSGNMYGTTALGGNINSDCPRGCGVIFEMAPNGQETILHAFYGVSDGSSPAAPPLLDASGNLYGSTDDGGSQSCSCGTVFELIPGGADSVLHSFAGGKDGAYPSYGSLVRDTAGDLYGTTSNGGGAGCHGSGCGTVFEITPRGEEILLHKFCAKAGCTDGAVPQFGLISDSAGDFYGTTSQGGTINSQCLGGCGVVYEITSKGKEIVLYSFPGAPDGASPYGDLLLDDAGNLYGTTAFGGSLGQGALFRINLASTRVRSRKDQ